MFASRMFTIKVLVDTLEPYGGSEAIINEYNTNRPAGSEPIRESKAGGFEIPLNAEERAELEKDAKENYRYLDENDYVRQLKWESFQLEKRYYYEGFRFAEKDLLYSSLISVLGMSNVRRVYP